MKAENPIIEAIKTRRSIRQFTKELVSDEVLDQILESGLWAPSGKNNQSWEFAVIRDLTLKRSSAFLTHYGSIIRNASVCIAVFLDHSRVYDRTKDVRAIYIDASIQKILLTIHSMGLGGVWLGEILKSKVTEFLEAGEDLELMAVVVLGHPSEHSLQSGTGVGQEDERGSRRRSF